MPKPAANNDDEYEWVDEKPTVLRKAIRVVREAVECGYGYAARGFGVVNGLYRDVDSKVAELRQSHPTEVHYAGMAGVSIGASLAALYATRRASVPTRFVSAVVAAPLATGLVYNPAYMAALSKRAVEQGKEGYRWVQRQWPREQQPSTAPVASVPSTTETSPAPQVTTGEPVEIETPAVPIVDRSVPVEAPADAVVEKE